MADKLKASNYPEWDEFISQARDSYIKFDLEKLKKMYPNKNIDEQFVRTYRKYNLVKNKNKFNEFYASYSKTPNDEKEFEVLLSRLERIGNNKNITLNSFLQNKNKLRTYVADKEIFHLLKTYKQTFNITLNNTSKSKLLNKRLSYVQRQDLFLKIALTIKKQQVYDKIKEIIKNANDLKTYEQKISNAVSSVELDMLLIQAKGSNKKNTPAATAVGVAVGVAATGVAAEKLKELLVIKKSARSEVNKLQLPNKNKQNFLNKINNAPNANATNTIVANAKKSVNNAAQNATNMFQEILNNKGTNVNKQVINDLKKQLSEDEKFKSLNKSDQEKILKSLNNGKTLNGAMKNINGILANNKVVANTVKGITERVIKKAEAENEKVVANTVKGITNRMIKENKNKLKELQIIRNSAKKEIIKLQLPNNKRTNLISKLNDAKNANQMNAISAQAKAESEKKVAQEAERKALQEKKNKEEVSQVVKGITNKMIQNNRKELRNMIQKANIDSKNKNRFLAMSKNSKISNTEIRKALNKKVTNVKSFKNSKEAQEKRKQRAEVKSSNENANKATELFSQMTQEPKKAVNRLTEGEKKNMQKQLNMAKPKERGLSRLGKKKLNARTTIQGRTNLNKNTLNRYMKQVNNAKQAHIISGVLKKLAKEKKKALPEQIPLSNIVPENVQTQINGGSKSRWSRIGKAMTAGLALSAGKKLPKQLPSKPGSSTALAVRNSSQAVATQGVMETPKINSVPNSKINTGKTPVAFSTGNNGVKTSNLSKKFTFSTNKNAKPFMIKINKKVQKYLNGGKKPESIFRLVAREVHPNKGGTKEEMQYLQKIKKQMLEGVGEAMTPKKFLPKSNNKSPSVISKALGGAMAPKKKNKNLTKVLNKLSNKAPKSKGYIEQTLNTAKKAAVSVGLAATVGKAAKTFKNSSKNKKTLTRTQTLEQAGAAGKKQVKARKGLLSEVHLKYYKNQVKKNNPGAKGRQLTKLLDELIWQKIQNKSINDNAKNPNIAGKFAGR